MRGLSWYIHGCGVERELVRPTVEDMLVSEGECRHGVAVERAGLAPLCADSETACGE